MKKMQVLFTVLMMILALSLLAQSEKGLIAEFTSADETLVTKDGKSSSNFTVAADQSQLETIKTKAGDFAPSMRLAVSPVKDQANKYEMTLYFDREAHIAEVHKMFLYFGFTGIKINTDEFALDYLLNIKK